MLHNCTLPYIFVAYTFANHHVIIIIIIKGKIFLTHEWKSYFHGLEIFKVLNWLMLQYWKTIVGDFFFNPIQDGLFPSCSRMEGGGQKGLPSIKSATHILKWWNLAQLYLSQKRSKRYMNHVTHPLSTAEISIFLPEINKFCYIKKYRYKLYFGA